MSPSTAREAPMVGAAVDANTHAVMAWISAPGHLAHLVPLPPETARSWTLELQQAADAADQLHGYDDQ